MSLERWLQGWEQNQSPQPQFRHAQAKLNNVVADISRQRRGGVKPNPCSKLADIKVLRHCNHMVQSSFHLGRSPPDILPHYKQTTSTANLDFSV